MATIRYRGGAASYGLELGDLSQPYYFHAGNGYRVPLAEADRLWFQTIPDGENDFSIEEDAPAPAEEEALVVEAAPDAEAAPEPAPRRRS